MSDSTTESDLAPSGIDRRSALKKAAVGGAIAWTVPTVLSSKVSAVEFLGACTAKCQPRNATGNVTISLSVAVDPCPVDTAPGDTIVQGTVTQVGENVPEPTCPCGGASVTLVSPQSGAQVELGSNPGSWTGDFAAQVQVLCTDRSGNEITQTCIVSASIGASGDCQDLGGNTYPVDNVPVGFCTDPECSAA